MSAAAHRPRWRDPRLWVLVLVSALVVLALRNPLASLDRPRFDYMFVLDVTQSMNVEDVMVDGAPATRLALARAAISHSLRRLPCGSRAGLAMFTEHRALMLFAPVEVCTNMGPFETTLGTLDWRLAWVSRSEVAKGVYSSMRALLDMAEDVKLVFVTDGHEAPPVPPSFHVPFEQYAGKVDGLLVGIGGLEPQPIPVLSPDGEVVGYWRAQDVQQLDNYQLGRSGDVEGEGIEDAAAVQRAIAAGTEHLSSLREEYLEGIAAKAQLRYRRVTEPADLSSALRDRRYARVVTVDMPLAAPLAAGALLALLVYLLVPAVAERLRRSASPVG